MPSGNGTTWGTAQASALKARFWIYDNASATVASAMASLGWEARGRKVNNDGSAIVVLEEYVKIATNSEGTVTAASGQYQNIAISVYNGCAATVAGAFPSGLTGGRNAADDGNANSVCGARTSTIDGSFFEATRGSYTTSANSITGLTAHATSIDGVNSVHGTEMPTAGAFGPYSGANSASDAAWVTISSVVAPPSSSGLTLSSTSPADNASSASVGSNITLTYSAAVSDGATGSYTLKKSSDNSTVQTWTSGQFSIAGATVTLPLASNMAVSTGYYVEASAGVVKRTSDNDPSPSISGSSAFNFTTQPPIEFFAVGTPAYSATSPAPSYIANVEAGWKIGLIVHQKPATANGGGVTTPSGFTLVSSITGAGGYSTTLAADTGNTNLYLFDKNTVTGSESGTLSITTSDNNSAMGCFFAYRVAAGYAISLAAATGSDTSAGNVSITFGSDPGLSSGDEVIVFFGIPTDVTTPIQFSSHAITATGATFGTVAELVEWDSTTGNDIGGVIARASVTGGPSSAAPVYTATAGGTTTNVRGPAIVLRLRAAVSSYSITGLAARPSGVNLSGLVSFGTLTLSGGTSRPAKSPRGLLLVGVNVFGAEPRGLTRASLGSVVFGALTLSGQRAAPGAVSGLGSISFGSLVLAASAPVGLVRSGLGSLALGTLVLLGASPVGLVRSILGALDFGTAIISGLASASTVRGQPGTINFGTLILVGGPASGLVRAQAGSVSFGTLLLAGQGSRALARGYLGAVSFGILILAGQGSRALAHGYLGSVTFLGVVLGGAEPRSKAHGFAGSIAFGGLSLGAGIPAALARGQAGALTFGTLVLGAAVARSTVRASLGAIAVEVLLLGSAPRGTVRGSLGSVALGALVLFGGLPRGTARAVTGSVAFGLLVLGGASARSSARGQSGSLVFGGLVLGGWAPAALARSYRGALFVVGTIEGPFSRPSARGDLGSVSFGSLTLLGLVSPSGVRGDRGAALVGVLVLAPVVNIAFAGVAEVSRVAEFASLKSDGRIQFVEASSPVLWGVVFTGIVRR